MDLDRVLNWHAELEARAAARAHFWIEEQDAPAAYQVPAGIDQVLPRHLPSSRRSQSLRAFEPLQPESVAEYPLDKEDSITLWPIFGHALAYLLQPESARGSLRPLRPPGTDEKSIRAPPQCRAGHADTESAEEQHLNSSSRASTGPATGATINDWNNLEPLRIYLTLRVLNHELLVARARVERRSILQRTNSCSAVFLDPLGDNSIEARFISRWHFLAYCKQQSQRRRDEGRFTALERVLKQLCKPTQMKQ